MAPIPVTIITGFLGSGKTTLILNLIPQLPKTYKVALLKNEFGDLEIDSKLASSSAISGVKELLNGCICCNLVGQLSDALETLRQDVSPDRIIIETSGSAFPATLAMEVNRIGREESHFSLDGVVVVVDVENWKGYNDTSYTATMQARYTDLIVFNKWELVDERRYDDCLDRVGDMEIQVAIVKSTKGFVEKELLLGLDSALAQENIISARGEGELDHEHPHNHQTEVEVLSISLTATSIASQAVDLDKLESLLKTGPKDEIYRIKGLVSASRHPRSSDDVSGSDDSTKPNHKTTYILNWAFSRWTFTPTQMSPENNHSSNKTTAIAQFTMVFARYESNKWKERLQNQGFISLEDSTAEQDLEIKRLM